MNMCKILNLSQSSTDPGEVFLEDNSHPWRSIQDVAEYSLPSLPRSNGDSLSDITVQEKRATLIQRSPLLLFYSEVILFLIQGGRFP